MFGAVATPDGGDWGCRLWLWVFDVLQMGGESVGLLSDGFVSGIAWSPSYFGIWISRSYGFGVSISFGFLYVSVQFTAA